MIFKHLADLCDITIGRTPSRSIAEYWGGSSPWVSISDMRSKYISETKECITDFGIEKARCRIIKKGTLLLSFKLSIGKLSFADRDLFTNEAIAALQIKDKKKLYPDYLFYVLRFIPLTGSNQAAMGKTLNSKSLAILRIPIPENYADQVRIAGILSRAEGLTEKRKESIRLLDEFLKSTFLEMFGDPVRNEKGWESAPLSNFGALDRGVSKHRPRNASHLLGGKYPLIQTGEVSNTGTYITQYIKTYSELGFQQSKLWNAGTLCITIAANIAKTGILTFDACFPDSVVGFTPDKKVTNILYIHHLFGFFQMILEKNAPQAAQKNINLDILRNLRVPKPPIQLQNKFASIVEKVETMKAKYQVSLEELERLYGSLSQRAFKGELDLSGVNLE